MSTTIGGDKMTEVIRAEGEIVNVKKLKSGIIPRVVLTININGNGFSTGNVIVTQEKE